MEMAGHKILEKISDNGMLQIETTCFCGKKETWNTPIDSDVSVLMVVPPKCNECREEENFSAR